jgi:hypothetical protein
MKAIYLIAATVLTLTGMTLFASGTDTKSASSGSSATTAVSNMLAPGTPAEATFDDASVSFDFPVDVVALAPLTPMNADFEDAPVTGNSPVPAYIAPITPMEADFDDAVTPENETTRLAPVPPAVADFDDNR